MEERYARNIPALNAEQQRLLGEKHVLIVGCGGLGGYLIETLARMGVGAMTAVDGDSFTQSNLNRQLLCTSATLGVNKARVAERRISEVNPKVTFTAVDGYLTDENADGLIRGKDLVLDALDGSAARLLLAQHCSELGIHIVHGAIMGWAAQVSVIPPGSGIMHTLYGNARDDAGVGQTCLSFAPELCAAIQSAEAAKLLCGLKSDLEGKLLRVDLRSMTWKMRGVNIG